MRVRIRTAAPRKTGGLFLLCATALFRRVSYTLSAFIDLNRYVSIKKMNQTRTHHQHRCPKATEHKPRSVPNRLNELYNLGLVSRHGYSRAAWNVR